MLQSGTCRRHLSLHLSLSTLPLALYLKPQQPHAANMALNAVSLTQERLPRPLHANENFPYGIHEGVKFSLIPPPGSSVSPSGSSASASSSGSKQSNDGITEKGTMALSNYRLIFISDPPADKHTPAFESFAVPLADILSTKYEQSIFKGNHLTLDVKPTPRGGLSDVTRVEVRFDGNGLYKFACALDEARERAIYMKRQSAEEEEGLPAYSTPGPSGASTPYAPGDIPDENPPGYDD
ncbi:hypothetical protein C8Q73DRAFT_680028 [Cubamyces lactineus]|nr:hypothetical protein C8Q73DRAFT_680028 [Cubamyces lactineus]